MLLAAPLAAQSFDLVIANGRVMDPATNLDGPRNIGIRAGKIAAISATLLQGRGRYVREQHALSLMDALRKMTVMPADRIGLKNKGRIAIGADADLTVFDPTRIIDRATFEKPDLPSEGIPYVVVGGTVVVRDGKTQETAMPGRAVASVR
jgi:N-acyl-D-aspartate/D-glutamate deacylase